VNSCQKGHPLNEKIRMKRIKGSLAAKRNNQDRKEGCIKEQLLRTI